MRSTEVSEAVKDQFFLRLLIGLFFILIFAYCWQPGYLDDDSLAYAQTAKLVSDTNQWLAFYDPSYGGQFYYHFPLVIWVTAILFKLFGVNVLAASLFSLISCLGAVIALFYFGKLIKNNWVGFFASAIFLFINFTWRLSRQCRMDMPLTFFIILSLYFFARGHRLKKINYLFFGLFAGLAIMSKDVNGLAPLAIACIFLVLTGKFREFLDPNFILGVIIAFFPVGIWILLEIRLVGFRGTIFSTWLRWNFLHLLRVKALYKPAYYYPLEIAKKYFYFLPLAIYGGYLGVRKFLTRKSTLPMLILAWLIFIPFAFSFGSQKLHYFIYSMYPAFALLCAIGLEQLCSQRYQELILKWAGWLIIALCLVRLCIPLSLTKAYFTDVVRLAPYLDSILVKAKPFEFYVFKQDDSALVFYSKELEQVRRIKDFESLEVNLLAKSSGKTRFFLLNQSDFDSLAPATKEHWFTWLQRDGRILIGDSSQR